MKHTNLEHIKMIDITGVEHGVEVQIRKDARVLWVNVDGICVLRICRLKPGQVYIGKK